MAKSKIGKSTVKTRPPFNEVPSAKVLLSQWIIQGISEKPVSLSDKETLLLNTLRYLLDETTIKKIATEDFDAEQLEKLLHQTAG